MIFELNGVLWTIVRVPENSDYLIDRLGRLTLATTDPNTKTVYISNVLKDTMLRHVLLHELGHCILFSFGLIEEIHKIVPPSDWVYAEEAVCNLFADYSDLLYSVANHILSYI